MMYLVVKHENGRDVCVCGDGSTTPNKDHGELMDLDKARLVADLYGGSLLSDLEAFQQEFQQDLD